MHTVLRLFPFLLPLFLLSVGVFPTRADDADAVKEKLFQAKKEFDTEVQKFKKAVTDSFDKRENDARKAGNKKLVDQIKAERDAFEKTGESASVVPNTIREPVAAARTKLDKAYTTATKEYLKLKMDDAAGATEKEQQEFHINSAFMFGKKAYLVTLKHFDVKAHAFTNNGTQEDGTKLTLNGELAPHSIYLHPPEKGLSQVSYPLGGKWTGFRATIGTPNVDGKNEDPRSPLTFEVVGDGKSLWKSEPVTKIDKFQTCTINVEKVKTLTLKVHCPDNNGWAWVFWIEPILAE
jgi:hypothetical protein